MSVELPGTEAPKPTWGLGDIFVVLLFGILGVVIMSIALFPITGEDPTTAELIIVGGVGLDLGMLFALFRVSRTKGHGSLRKDFGFEVEPRDAWGLAAGFGLQIVIALASIPLFELFGVDDSPQDLAQRLSDEISTTTLVVATATVAVLAPIVEELVFRGLALRAFARRYNSIVWAVILSSALFAAIHLLDSGAAIVVPSLFVVGVVLALATHRRGGSLSLAIFMHMGFNLTAVVALLLA